MARLSVCGPFFLWMGIASAQPFGGPVEGFTFDVPTRSFRAVIGSLGSASLGPAQLHGVEFGSVAPLRNHGLAFHDGRCIVVSGLGSDRVSTTEISGSFPLPEGVAWSGDGSVAVLYSRTGNWIQALRGFPDAPRSDAVVNVSTAGGTLSAVTVDQHGDRIALGVVGDNSGVYQIANGQGLVLLVSLSRPIALNFDANTLYVLDAATKQVSKVNVETMVSDSWPLSTPEDPIAIRRAYDTTRRQVLYIAGKSDRLLVAYDASSHEILTSLPLDAEPAFIEPLGRGSFLLGPRVNHNDPLWSFTSAPQPLVYFVPATPAGMGQDLAQ